ncbi:unnamed protein product, partial [Mesorhabditis spiculigera]
MLIKSFIACSILCIVTAKPTSTREATELALDEKGNSKFTSEDEPTHDSQDNASGAEPGVSPGLAGNLAVPTTLQLSTSQFGQSGPDPLAPKFNSRGAGKYMVFAFQQVNPVQQAPIVGIPLSTIQHYYNPHVGRSVSEPATPEPIPTFDATAYYPLVWKFPFSNIQLPAYTTTGHYAYTANLVKYYGTLPSQTSEKVQEANDASRRA